MYLFVSLHTSTQQLREIKGHRKPSSLLSLTSIMSFRKRRNTDEESTKKLLAANREVDEHSEKTDEEDDVLERWWLHMQQIDVEDEEEGDGEWKKEQTDHKLKSVTVGYSSGGLMKEEIITFMTMWDLPKHKDSSLLAFIIPNFFTDILQLLVEQTNTYYKKYSYKIIKKNL